MILAHDSQGRSSGSGFSGWLRLFSQPPSVIGYEQEISSRGVPSNLDAKIDSISQNKALQDR